MICRENKNYLPLVLTCPLCDMLSPFVKDDTVRNNERVIQNVQAPYAPVSNVIDVLDHYRDKGPRLLDKDLMIRLGLSDTYGTRVLNSLKWLGLIDERGNPQESFEELKKASNDGYPDKLAEVVRKAYSRVFEAVEPSEVSDKQITDAFRSYEPVAQINLMVKTIHGALRKSGDHHRRPSSQKTHTKHWPERKEANHRCQREEQQAAKQRQRTPFPRPDHSRTSKQAAFKGGMDRERER